MEPETVVASETKPVRRKPKTDDIGNVGFVGLKLGDFKNTLEATAAENNMGLSELCREILEDGIDNYGVSRGAELLKACEATKAVASRAAKTGMEPEVVATAHKKLGEIRDILPPAPRTGTTSRGYLFRRSREARNA